MGKYINENTMGKYKNSTIRFVWFLPHIFFLSQSEVEQIYFGKNPNQTEQQNLRTIQCLHITAYFNRRSILSPNMALQKIPVMYLNTTRPNTPPNPGSISQILSFKETETSTRTFSTEKKQEKKFCLVITHSSSLWIFALTGDNIFTN